MTELTKQRIEEITDKCESAEAWILEQYKAGRIGDSSRNILYRAIQTVPPLLAQHAADQAEIKRLRGAQGWTDGQR